MSIGNWKIMRGFLQGDISYELRKTLVTPSYATFELVAFGEKWKEFDIIFEYRINNVAKWRDDASIIESSSKYLDGNKIYGLKASNAGETNIITWKYSNNGLSYGSVPQIRLRFLPRVRAFGTSGKYHSIASLYGYSFSDLNGLSHHNCIGINGDGNYMCLGEHNFYIIDSLDAADESTSSSSSSSSSSSTSSSSSSSSSRIYSESSNSLSSLSSSLSSSSSSSSTSSSSSSSSSTVRRSSSSSSSSSRKYSESSSSSSSSSTWIKSSSSSSSSSDRPPYNGMLLWLDASTITGIPNHGYVSTWYDRSSYNRNATTLDVYPPTYNKVASNGRPAVEFDNSGTDSLKFNSISNARTVFFVAQESFPADHFIF